jgi:hypothetical protein
LDNSYVQLDQLWLLLMPMRSLPDRSREIEGSLRGTKRRRSSVIERVTVDSLPDREALTTGGDGADLGEDAIGDDEQLVGMEVPGTFLSKTPWL